MLVCDNSDRSRTSYLQFVSEINSFQNIFVGLQNFQVYGIVAGLFQRDPKKPWMVFDTMAELRASFPNVLTYDVLYSTVMLEPTMWTIYSQADCISYSTYLKTALQLLQGDRWPLQKRDRGASVCFTWSCQVIQKSEAHNIDLPSGADDNDVNKVRGPRLFYNLFSTICFDVFHCSTKRQKCVQSYRRPPSIATSIPSAKKHKKASLPSILCQHQLSDQVLDHHMKRGVL